MKDEQRDVFSITEIFGSKKILHLPISKIPFDVMVTGEKNIEYRNPSEWILSRLCGKEYDFVKFVNGYGSHRPYFIAVFDYWEIEKNPYSPYTVEYSNGLRLIIRNGTVKIYLGRIVERGNIKSLT